MTTKAVAKKGPQAVGLAAELGELQEAGGFIEVRKELITIPRLQLGQALSDGVQAGLGKAGEFLSKVKGKNYGATVKIIPILVSESAALLDKKTNKLICRSDNLSTNTDGVACTKCPHGQYWNDWSGDEGPQCRTSIDVVCIVNDEMEMPQVLSFRKTSYKAGKALLNLIMHDKFKVPFGSQYTLKSAAATKDDWKYFIIEESPAKEQLTEALIKQVIPIAKQLLDMKKQGRIKHEEEAPIKENPPTEEEVVQGEAEQADLPI